LKEGAVRNKNSLPSSKIKDISEMERVIDKILLENKGKLIFKGKVNRNKKQYSNKTDLESFDVKNFSPVNRKKDSIYFVKDKKKPVKKKETKNLDKKTTKEKRNKEFR